MSYLKDLDIQDEQSLISLLLAVQCGRVSCRQAASEIRKQIPKRRLTPDERLRVGMMRTGGHLVKDIAHQFNINPATVWRICKAKERGE